MSIVRQCLRLGKTGVRQFATNNVARSAASETEATEAFKKLVKNQQRFQKEDLIEDVFVKGGVIDVFLYRFVLVGTFVGVGLTLKDLYNLALI